jgi:3-oxoacyl-[acyl-carrier protein] reductase
LRENELETDWMTDAKTVAAGNVILSGGSRGLGMALAIALLDAGYRVSTFSRRGSEFTESLANDDRFLFATADVSDTKSISRFTASAVERFGPPYGLINCAGIAVDGVLAMMSEHCIDNVLQINLGGALKLTRLVTRSMLLCKRPGAIINISSIIGLRGYNGMAAYAATKAGLDAMTRALARELGGRGIRVNSVAPGYLKTEMTHGLDESQMGQIVRRTPLNRLGVPADVVGPVLFLLSDAARFITGQVLAVDGGITT